MQEPSLLDVMERASSREEPPALKSLGFPPPVRTSSKSLPMIFSILLKVSDPAPPVSWLSVRLRLTVTDAPALA